MDLQLECADIADIRFGMRTAIANNVLTIDRVEPTFDRVHGGAATAHGVLGGEDS